MAGKTAGSGGRIRRGLKGKGPTPKAEDRPHHKAYRPRSRPGTRAERPAGSEWVSGRNPVLEALQAEVPANTAYVAEGVERDDRLQEILKLAATRGLPVLEVSRARLDRMVGPGVHQGVALQLPEYSYLETADLIDLALKETRDRVVVALDSIKDPHNLGAIVRSAAAFGASGALIPTRRTAGITAAAWKSSAGAAARLPVARASNLTQALTRFADAGFTVIGLDGGGPTMIADIDLSGPVVLVVGSEGDGLSRLVREKCDLLAAIPIRAEVESLNASVAAGIALYEVSRASSHRAPRQEGGGR